MDKFNVRRLRILLTTIFAVMALALFIVAGIIYYQLTQMKTIFQPAEARIMYTTARSEYPMVEYEWKEETYYSILDFQSSRFYEGEVIQVFVNPKKPTQVEVETGYWVGIGITGGMGVVLMIMGLGVLIFMRSRKNRQEKLLLTGKRIEAEIEEVFYNTMMSAGSRHPYIIFCSWKNPADGVCYHFRSANLWEDPAPILEKYQIKTLPVYLDERHIRHYFIALDCITEKCGENIYL